jgi:hypothetical protein
MPKGEGLNLEALVELYNKERLYGFLLCLKQKENLADCTTGCLNKGQLSNIHDAKFHSHVRRFPSHREAVLYVARRIKEKEKTFVEAKDFKQLIGSINESYGYANDGQNHVKFFGPLYIYDTAIRVGYHLWKEKFMPKEYVFLQAGAWTGAVNLLGEKAVKGLIKERKEQEKKEEKGKSQEIANKNLKGLTYVKKEALFNKVYELEHPGEKLETEQELEAGQKEKAEHKSVLEKLADKKEIEKLINGLEKKKQSDPKDVEILKDLKKLREWMENEGEPTKSLIVEDFFCVFEDYLEGAATRKQPVETSSYYVADN